MLFVSTQGVTKYPCMHVCTLRCSLLPRACCQRFRIVQTFAVETSLQLPLLTLLRAFLLQVLHVLIVIVYFLLVRRDVALAVRC
jgi:hypothetical protein